MKKGEIREKYIKVSEIKPEDKKEDEKKEEVRIVEDVKKLEEGEKLTDKKNFNFKIEDFINF
jgi:hypothetical protein